MSCFVEHLPQYLTQCVAIQVHYFFKLESSLISLLKGVEQETVYQLLLLIAFTGFIYLTITI